MDDLTRINGIGPAAAKKLAEAGITTFEQLAHDAVAGEHGVKVEWISEAAKLIAAASEGSEQGSSPDAREEPKAEDGSGNAAAPAAIGDTLIQAGTITVETLSDPDASHPMRGDRAVSDFPDLRTLRPHLAAAIDRFHATAGDRQPRAIRITAKRDGFRRAGMAHSKEPREHPLETFQDPDALEALFAEPNLVTEIV